MKVLTDTCVWSLALRRKRNSKLNHDEEKLVRALTTGIQDGNVVMIGPIRQEILSGVKEVAQFERLRLILDAFTDEQLKTKHYEEAARLFNLLRSEGIAAGPLDILICAAVRLNGWALLTNDQGLVHCMQELKRYS